MEGLEDTGSDIPCGQGSAEKPQAGDCRVSKLPIKKRTDCFSSLSAHAADPGKLTVGSSANVLKIGRSFGANSSPGSTGFRNARPAPSFIWPIHFSASLTDWSYKCIRQERVRLCRVPLPVWDMYRLSLATLGRHSAPLLHAGPQPSV